MDISMSSGFSFARVLQLCKRNLFLKKKMILIGLAALIGLLLVLYAGIYAFTPTHLDVPKESLEFSGKNTVFTIALRIFQYVGYAFTSTMFYELNSTGSAPQFFTLPAKTSEKLLSAWLISYVGYTVFGIIVLYLFSLIMDVDQKLFFSTNTFNELWMYTILQSIFLFGAVYFKANNFLSTIVAILGFMISLGLIFFLLNLFFDDFEAWSFTIPTTLLASTTSHIISSIVFTILVSALFIWFTYLRLKNRQIA